MTMNITTYSYTNRGGRPENEDSICLESRSGRTVLTLADGLGGHGGGEVASALAVNTVCQACLDCPSVDETALVQSIQAANQKILDGQTASGLEEMRTTLVALYLEGEHSLWAHVGDSRLYRLSQGTITQLTRDHSVTYRKYLGGEITRMDVYHDDDRSSLLRVLGRPSCSPETGSAPLQPGAAFLLCSDGFWEYVYQEEILADWLKSETPEQWAQLMLLRHIRRAPKGNDNFSLITVFVEEHL